MSQTSLEVRQRRGGEEMYEKGLLPEISEYSSEEYLTTTAVVHYKYSDQGENAHRLEQVTLVAIPNGKLQHFYNPGTDDGIWGAGRNAPTLGEDFRARLSFSKLKAKKAWRVQKIYYDATTNKSTGVWNQ